MPPPPDTAGADPIPPPPERIEPLAPEALDAFFAHLCEHLAENGADGTAPFQPAPRGPSRVLDELAQAFRTGLVAPALEAGWRRAWVARDAQGCIVGHVDLRARREPWTSHRCLLGMGVRRPWRGRGLGTRLLQQAEAWAAATDSLEWIDLEVLAANLPALALYRRAGYTPFGETPDLFRIEGASLGAVWMTKRITPDRAPADAAGAPRA
jgi:RimJ/RimL family protein N-acetyltransferase